MLFHFNGRRIARWFSFANEGRGFSRAVKPYEKDGFSRGGTLFKPLRFGSRNDTDTVATSH
jgi:hypothetical protein